MGLKLTAASAAANKSVVLHQTRMADALLGRESKASVGELCLYERVALVWHGEDDN